MIEIETVSIVTPTRRKLRVKKVNKHPENVKINLKDQNKKSESTMSIDEFWNSISKKEKLSQLQRYEKKNSPDNIKKFIAIGGGAKMGTTLEQYARFRFKSLQKRSKGKEETGYDHKVDSYPHIYIEQKSSGHWGEDDYKWQHVEMKHKWNMLLLCGIDYEDIHFWGMNRETYIRLISEKKITNQGNKAGDSSEGMWFNYSDVKDSLVEIQTEEQLLQFVSSLPISDE